MVAKRSLRMRTAPAQSHASGTQVRDHGDRPDRRDPRPSGQPVRSDVCPLCDRPIVPGPSADAHHLVPRSEGGRLSWLVHRVCHRMIHATFDERELATLYNSWDALRAAPEMAAFVRWVRRRPAEFYDGSVRSRRLRRR